MKDRSKKHDKHSKNEKHSHEKKTHSHKEVSKKDLGKIHGGGLEAFPFNSGSAPDGKSKVG